MKTLVLAPSFTPIGEIDVERAVILLLEGKAQSLRNHPARIFRNADGRVRIPAPLVIVLEALAGFAGVVFGQASWTRSAVYLRDGRTCQYCGRHERELVRGPGLREVALRYGRDVVRMEVRSEFLTVDHITPRCEGGRDEFTNTVTACSTCNNRKDALRPAEARMYLRRKPRSVTRADLFLARLGEDAREAVEELFARPRSSTG